jgi:hypothetical protein
MPVFISAFNIMFWAAVIVSMGSLLALLFAALGMRWLRIILTDLGFYNRSTKP